MRIVDKYLLGDFLKAFVLALLVFTFVMCVGALIKIIDLLARGISGWLMLKAFLYSMPNIMTFTIPISTLVTTLLMFSRLHSDHEIPAFKACGISLWRLVSPIFLAGVALMILCLSINNIAAPSANHAKRKLLYELGTEDPISLLDEGRFVKEFPGIMVYLGNKDGTNLTNIIVYETAHGSENRKVRAKRGEVVREEGEKALRIILYEARITIPDPKYPNEPTRGRIINARRYPVRLDFSELMRDKNLEKRRSEMGFFELIRAALAMADGPDDPDMDPDAFERLRSLHWVEAHERLTLAVACAVFTLIGIPLGIGSPRRESTYGVSISIGIMFSFYFFVILAKNLAGKTAWPSEMISWVPLILSAVAGIWMINRSN